VAEGETAAQATLSRTWRLSADERHAAELRSGGRQTRRRQHPGTTYVVTSKAGTKVVYAGFTVVAGPSETDVVVGTLPPG
jgi:hypothetical protein